MLGARFLTCSCQGRLPLFEDDWVKREFVDALIRTHNAREFGLIAWVLMPEHFHLLLIPQLPEWPVSWILNMLKGTMSRRVLARWRRERSPRLTEVRMTSGEERFWLHGGGHDRNPDEWDGLMSIVRYIHLNPVRRGIVANAVDWPWSSVHGYLKKPTPVELVDPRLFRQEELARLTKSASLKEILNRVRASRSKAR
jgi:putative transposase